MTTIYLIRHATPDVGNPYCDYAQAVELLNEYNQTVKLRLEETCVAPSFEELPIYSSPLPRAKLTAETLFPTRTILFDERLQEFNLTIAPIKWLKCRFQHWLAISRLLWFCGLHQCGNTPKQEKQRIADFIQQHLLASGIVVAHGFVLREIKKSLHKQGFTSKILAKSGCFTVEYLSK